MAFLKLEAFLIQFDIWKFYLHSEPHTPSANWKTCKWLMFFRLLKLTLLTQTWTPMVSNTLTGGIWKVWELICDWKPFKFNLTFESATCLLKNWQIFVVFTLIKYCSCLINYHELNCRIMWLTFLKLEAFLIQFDICKFYLHSKPHTPSANWKTCKWLMFLRLLKLTSLTDMDAYGLQYAHRWVMEGMGTYMRLKAF